MAKEKTNVEVAIMKTGVSLRNWADSNGIFYSCIYQLLRGERSYADMRDRAVYTPSASNTLRKLEKAGFTEALIADGWDLEKCSTGIHTPRKPSTAKGTKKLTLSELSNYCMDETVDRVVHVKVCSTRGPLEIKFDFPIGGAVEFNALESMIEVLVEQDDYEFKFIAK